MTRATPLFRREIGLPLLLAGTITLCSGFPAAVPQSGWIEFDKLGHFAAYGALATAIVRIPSLARWPLIRLWWALVFASAYGMGDEFRQSLTHGIRSPDWHDWLADTIGAVTAVTLYVTWPWYRRIMETRFWRSRAKAQVAGSQEHSGARS